MPEVLEAERCREALARLIGEPVVSLSLADPRVGRPLREGDLRRAVVGRDLRAVRRRGKLLLLDLTERRESAARPSPVTPPRAPLDEPLAADELGRIGAGDRRADRSSQPGRGSDSTRLVTLGLHLGLAGRLLVDGVDVLGPLLYGPRHLDDRWLRLEVTFGAGRRVALFDPRRLARIRLDPEEARIGLDVTTVDAAELALLCSGRRRGLKSLLLDQGRLAGLGNLLADEALWRAGLDPRRPAGSLELTEITRLSAAIVATLADLGARGGSHTGDLAPARRPGGRCPVCGAPLCHDLVAGRSTWWCAALHRLDGLRRSAERPDGPGGDLEGGPSVEGDPSVDRGLRSAHAAGEAPVGRALR